MDPASIIGISGFALQVAGSLGKTILALNGILDRWNGTELFAFSLRTQLGALRAALLAIHQIINTTADTTYYALQLEINASLTCCQMLLSKIDEFISDITLDVSDESSLAGRIPRLDFKGKAKVIFAGSTMEEVLRMVDRQTNSLNLLLTACNL